MTSRTEADWLEAIYVEALSIYEGASSAPDLPEAYANHIQTIAESQQSSRGVLAVTVTLLVKKLATPGQDIRQHQAQLEGGFSGRGLDERVVTPFLRDKRFPYMQGGSGWLTRSLEQSQPYTLDYSGNIRPLRVKQAFLGLVDGVQCQGVSAHDALRVLFGALIEFRDRNSRLVLSRPVNLSVAQVSEKVRQHRDFQAPGTSRLPVLAIHAVLGILGRETSRYRNHIVLPLEPHNAADTRTNLIGDVNVVDANGVMFEGYEIKHGIPVTQDLIDTSFAKIQTTPVQRYYILTTFPHSDYAEFDPAIRRVAQSHGCQLIINGVDQTLKYYLRLVGDAREFVDAYVTHLESDPSITFALKEAWNQVVSG